MAKRITVELSDEAEKKYGFWFDSFIGLASLFGVDLSIEEKARIRDLKPEEIHEIKEETNAEKSS